LKTGIDVFCPDDEHHQFPLGKSKAAANLAVT